MKKDEKSADNFDSIINELKKLSNYEFESKYNKNDSFAIWNMGQFESKNKNEYIEYFLEMIFALSDQDQMIKVYNSMKEENDPVAIYSYITDPVIRLAKELNIELIKDDSDEEEIRFEKDLENQLHQLSDRTLIEIGNKYLSEEYNLVNGDPKDIIFITFNNEEGLLKILEKVDFDSINDSVQKQICDSFNKRYKGDK